VASLSDVIPEDSQTVQAIYAYWKQRGDSEQKRGYLGGSAIGEECERKLWYSFRECSAESFEGRLYRLFNRGHREEYVFVEDLQGIGCDVRSHDGSGKQFEVTLFGGHFKGHCDGVALGIPEAPKTWHLLEMKTSNTKDFIKLKSEGVEKCKPVHFAQMQIYMDLMKLDRALYICVCKETDELYSERIKRDPAVGKALADKARRIIFANTPPARISEKADFYKCKWCSAQGICHGIGETAVPVPALSCRQCCHATPEEDGTWSCGQGREFGTVCERHLMLPGLVHFAEPSDGLQNEDGSHVIEFTSKDGKAVWHHGPKADAGQYSSHHLMSMPRDLIELPREEPVKEDSGVTHPNLEAKYSLENDGIERVWMGKAADIQSEWCRFVEYPMSRPIFTQETKAYTAADFGTACAIIYSDGRAEIRKDNNQ